MKKILVLHGPNLNLLGTREPLIYGAMTLDEINTLLIKEAQQAGFELTCYQSNSEADLIKAIHQAGIDKINNIIFNPAGFTHTSVVLRDALCAVAIPFIEVHISNIYSREPFRHHSYFSDIATGTISGLGAQGYLLALTSIIERESNNGHS
ncbi:type II 3-dehydroquinate dehydratase [Fluoribacter dumoffii]|uniref:3-dehydroquinate dehydratase n=1 Tax=Fluoribacter dumoffii TaxID=463 RepID=A0A377GCL1_9GAMM|nr:type II 3-dehydroquinate dehydratase [Fluoribacter dumoffii]KTC90969.1 3-dehydroquinate dehydratase [Fluoribacter dumoffii NY 23]MCW8419592.1 type II 3-dehydroquinate dehydratase [Fluoribacter dumoffii]MCW8455705.1 type II 3-dehydroquinate dehydratase [Fluoribacter dumoffii]MCW8460216.1 type II 3-dehydroquinate dehydratase [Fluoribacter dumoffii]MCW8483695.1 type II 3-dehydroquinate dehydratase [Fluoribacter dumoffii]